MTDKNCAAIDCPKAWLFGVVRQEVPSGLRRELGHLLCVASLSADLYASRSLGGFQEVGGTGSTSETWETCPMFGSGA